VKWLTQIVTWGTTLVVARLLAPSDYGLIGMAGIWIYLMTLFSEFGLGTAIITVQELTDHQISQLNSVSLILGFVGFGISAAVAYPLGHFFKSAKLPVIIIVMSIGFVISAFRTVPYSLLQKELRFKLLALIEGLQSLSQAITTLVFALLGFGYWALALGGLAFALAPTALTLLWKRQAFAWPRFSELRGALAYSYHIVIGRLSWYAYNDADAVVAGRVLGQAPLGSYTLAWTLAQAPLEKLSTLVNRVMPSIYATIQSDYASLRRYLRNITSGLSLVIFPAVLGMALVARPFVAFALGSKWSGVILPLQLLCIHALIRSNVILLTPVLNVVGEQRFVMWNSLYTMFILPVAFYVGSRWGTAGIAGVWIVVYPFVSLPLFWRLFRKIQMSITEYLTALWPALNGCVFMVVAIELCKRLVSPTQPPYVRFFSEIVVGALAYTLTLVSLHRKHLRAFLRLIRELRRQPA
jgi:PST family polysaccharide transporter